MLTTIKSFSKFTEVNETYMTEGGCMSEKMMAQCESICEAMCEEMKACHMDESELTAENYKAACNEKLHEMMGVIEKMCNEYMASNKVS